MMLGPPPPLKHFKNQKNRALLEVLRENVAPILANNILPHFTDHTVEHSDNVAVIADSLLEGIAQPLTDPELMILYSACYLHDIGMQYERAMHTQAIQQLKLDPPWEEQSESARRNLLRRHHHQISAEMVQASVDSAFPPIGFQLTSDFNAPYVAQLCHAHAISVDSQAYRELVVDAPNIRLPLLTAILRLADILDESRRRASREKGRTLLLDMESQTHWWRHYYTEDVEFTIERRLITIWFDFPENMSDEYSRVVPRLQMPWIEAELAYHKSTLVQYGCQWSLCHQSRSRKYSDTAPMPDQVLMAMLQELARQRQMQDEAHRVASLMQFKEARPVVQRRLESLKERESEIEEGEFLLELSRIADDLYGLGGEATARSLLTFRYIKNLHHLSQDDRLRIGLDLLQWQIDAKRNYEIMSLIEKLDPEFSTLSTTDRRKLIFTKLRIDALDSVCAYTEVQDAIAEALQWVPQSERSGLEASTRELSLLQGDF